MSLAHFLVAVWASNDKFLGKVSPYVNGNKLVAACASLVPHGSCGTWARQQP